MSKSNSLKDRTQHVANLFGFVLNEVVAIARGIREGWRRESVLAVHLNKQQINWLLFFKPLMMFFAFPNVTREKSNSFGALQ